VGGARRWRGTAATPGGGFALVLAATPLVDVRVWTAGAVAELWGIKEVGPGGGPPVEGGVAQWQGAVVATGSGQGRRGEALEVKEEVTS
jgi:hypothetical protein